MTAPSAAGATHVPLSGDWQLWRLAAVRGAGLPFGLLDAFAVAEDRAASARDVSAEAARGLVACDPFLEALTWQNMPVIDNWLGRYSDEVRAAPSEPVPLARRDQRESLLAFLAQRYCAKNETIGFFGPVAWAVFDAGPGLRCTGSGRLRSRSLYVEGWAAAAIADAIAADPRLADAIALRRHPQCAVLGGMVYGPGSPPRPADDMTTRVLAALSRPLPPAALRARVLGGRPDPDALVLLDKTVGTLLEAGLLRHGRAVPIGDRPERALREIVGELPAGPARDDWSAVLDGFDAALGRVAGAAGDPLRVRDALAELGRGFAGWAGRTGRQDKQTRYHGRGVVYEDCRRDLDAGIGPDLLDDLRAPLALLLDSAAWLVAEVGAEVRDDLLTRYRALRARRDRISLADMTFAAADVLSGAPGTAVHRVLPDFTQRWAELLDLGEPGEPVRTAGLRRMAAALFPRRTALPWAAACQHSPDLMLRHGPGLARPQWVVGELHLALNTLENRPFVTQADDPEALRAAARADFPGGRVVPVYPRAAPDVTSRTYPPLAIDLPDLYTYWSYGDDEGHPDGVPSWPGTVLEVVEDAADLWVRPPGGDWRLPLAEFYGEFLTALVVNRFRIRPRAAHLPRLLLDDVVVERESWHVPAADVPVGGPQDGDYAMPRLAGWLADLGCPRHVFVRATGEPKPFLVDRRSPLLLRGLARSVRRAVAHDPRASVDIAEMLPAPDELWLADADGNRYTSELRVVASHRTAVRPELGRHAFPDGGDL
jgi:lantibiotic biosynthesis dehydratase-like protein